MLRLIRLIQAESGSDVIPAISTRRVERSMTKSMTNRVKPRPVQMSTAKKSVAEMTSQCVCTNSAHVVFFRRSGAASRPCSRRIVAIVRRECLDHVIAFNGAGVRKSRLSLWTSIPQQRGCSTSTAHLTREAHRGVPQVEICLACSSSRPGIGQQCGVPRGRYSGLLCSGLVAPVMNDLGPGDSRADSTTFMAAWVSHRDIAVFSRDLLEDVDLQSRSTTIFFGQLFSCSSCRSRLRSVGSRLAKCFARRRSFAR